jgi:hypothetical protein
MSYFEELLDIFFIKPPIIWFRGDLWGSLEALLFM